MFEPAILPHRPPALLRYKSLPSHVNAGVYTALLIRCALSMVTAVCVGTAVCTQLSLCVAHTCVAQQYSCVFACVGCAYVFEPDILPHLPPAFLRYKCLPSTVYAGVYSGVHTALAVCVCSAYMTCVAQQYSCVFACVGNAYVFELDILPHLPPAFLRHKSLPSPVYASSPMYVDYASPATAVRPVTSVCVFQHVTSYTCVQRNPCAYCHHTMRSSSPNSAVPCTGD